MNIEHLQVPTMQLHVVGIRTDDLTKPPDQLRAFCEQRNMLESVSKSGVFL